MAKIITFDEAMKASDGEERPLLIGNGFSIKHFSYRNLLEKSGLSATGPLRALFNALDTIDFEVVIKALEDAAIVERTYNKIKRAELFSSDSDILRRALVHAIRQIHPAHRADIQDVIPKCLEFLLRFTTIFTLNYDLLLYWVILENGTEFRDGFGLGKDGVVGERLDHIRGQPNCILVLQLVKFIDNQNRDRIRSAFLQLDTDVVGRRDIGCVGDRHQVSLPGRDRGRPQFS
jgi:hypothetical protein